MYIHQESNKFFFIGGECCYNNWGSNNGQMFQRGEGEARKKHVSYVSKERTAVESRA